MHDESEIIAAAWHRLRWVEQQQQQHQQRAARADGRLLAGHREKKSPLPKGRLVLSHHWPRSRATGARSSTGGSSRDSISRGGSICTRLPLLAARAGNLAGGSRGVGSGYAWARREGRPRGRRATLRPRRRANRVGEQVARGPEPEAALLLVRAQPRAARWRWSWSGLVWLLAAVGLSGAAGSAPRGARSGLGSRGTARMRGC